MLQITIPGEEYFNEVDSTFIYTKQTTLTLEHSLISISKWESKWKVPFLGPEPKTLEQLRDYIRCMTINQNVDPMVYQNISIELIEEVQKYMGDSMTATWFREEKNRPKGRRIITSELIYYWMIAAQVPIECQKWHFNRLMTLLRICSEEQQAPKKANRKEQAAQTRSLNAARRAKLHTKG